WSEMPTRPSPPARAGCSAAGARRSARRYVAGSAPNVGFRDGWYYTGEIASLDELGYIHLTGRASELIMRGGAKIHPAEVEAVLQQHADVLEAAVFGRRGVNNEEEVIACVVGRG